MKAALIALALTLGLFGTYLLWSPPFLTTTDGQISDAMQRWRGVRPAPESIVVLALDDAALGDDGTPAAVRPLLAEAVRAATAAGAAVIAIDHLLAGETADDPALVAALAAAPAVLLAVAPTGGTAEPSEALRRALLRSAMARAAIRDDPGGGGDGLTSYPLGSNDALLGEWRLGHVAVAPDADGVLRRMAMAASVANVVLPSLPLAAVASAQEDAGTPLVLNPEGLRIGTDAPLKVATDGRMWLSFYGSEGAIATLSLAEVAEQGTNLDGRIVFVGTTATGFGDRHATPFDRTLPGVEFLATAAANLLDGRFLRQGVAEFLVSFALAVVTTVVVAWAISALAPMFAALLVVTVVGLTAIATWLAFAGGQVLFVGAIGLALLLATASATIRRVLAERREASNLERFTAPGLRRTLRRHGGLGPQAGEIEAAALCIDVVGFTQRSAALSAADTATFLSAFHTAVEQAVLPHGGVVEHFTGDGVMVIFGLSEERAPAASAMAAIAALEATLGGLSRVYVHRGEAPLVVRITGHAGKALPAVLGGRSQGHVTLTGPVLTGAARLQEVAKSVGAELLVSGELAGDGETVLEDFGWQPIRGWPAPVRVLGRRRSD